MEIDALNLKSPMKVWKEAWARILVLPRWPLQPSRLCLCSFVSSHGIVGDDEEEEEEEEKEEKRKQKEMTKEENDDKG